MTHCRLGMKPMLQPTMRSTLLIAVAILASAATPNAASSQAKSVTTRATGTFDVKLTPQPSPEPVGEGSPLGRLTIDKQFHGDLEGTSKGEMLTAGSTTVKNSAGYVAVERVTG